MISQRDETGLWYLVGKKEEFNAMRDLIEHYSSTETNKSVRVRPAPLPTALSFKHFPTPTTPRVRPSPLPTALSFKHFPTPTTPHIIRRSL